jgi:peptidoglycan hydrolase CwlO-like protein
MTTERRLQTIEETLGMLADLNQTVVAMLASHDEQLASIREDNRTVAELNQTVAALLASHDEQLASLREDANRTKDLLAEAREDNRMTRNLWVNLARRYGWLDDEDLQG